LNVFAKAFVYKIFSQNSFRGSLGIGLSTGRNAGRGKVARNWISPDPVKAGPTLGGVVVVYKSSFRLIPPTLCELCLVGISLLISTNPFMPTSYAIFAIHYISICFYQYQSHISISFPL